MPANSGALDALAQAHPGLIGAPPPAYLEDPRGNTGGPAALARPRDLEQLAALLSTCNTARIAVIPRGGGTGLVGGQVAGLPVPPLLVSLERMNRIRSVDAPNASLVAEAGVTLAAVQEEAAAVGRLFPLSLASEGSCTIGGNLSTNAGGLNTLRYGNARDQVLGIEAVLADGTVIRDLKGLRKDNTGYDLRHLLIGAEGTLGIITAASLKLAPQPAEISTAILDIGDPAGALALLDLLRAELGAEISAFELVSRQGIQLLQETMPDHELPPVGDGDWLALVELGGGKGAQIGARFERLMEVALTNGVLRDGHLASSQAQRGRIWAMREAIPEANRRVGAVASNDISVPISAIPDFIAHGAARFARFGLRINCFGHMGDGNLHYNFFPPKGASKDTYLHLRPEIMVAVNDLVAEFGGSFSAEHGVGRLKAGELARRGDPGKLVAMRAIKAALDPVGILNPGAVLADLA